METMVRMFLMCCLRYMNADKNTGDILSCGAALTCAIDGTAIGCCPNTFGYCDALYTTCYNWGDTCGGSCQKNNAILKWYVTVHLLQLRGARQ